jgi:hypothetical protein
MTTRGEGIVGAAGQAYAEAVALSGRDHTPQEFAGFLKDLGSDVEVFLKDAVYAGTQNNTNFVALINGLPGLGLPHAVSAPLHALRQGYNAAKHNPNYAPAVNDVIGILDGAKGALTTIRDSGVGQVTAPVVRSYRRVFWFAAWDHYIGGDTEIHLMLPITEGDWAPGLDIIYIDMKSWDVVRETLLAAGSLYLGKGTVPDKHYDSWAAEGDFLAGGRYEGNYRDLLRLLAAHERVEDLIPFLKRENDAAAMHAAAVMAAVDVVTTGQIIEEQEALTELIAVLAANTYAAPRNSPYIKHLAPRLAKMLLAIGPPVRAAMSGPHWVTAATFDKEAAAASLCPDHPKIAVTDDGRFLVRL